MQLVERVIIKRLLTEMRESGYTPVKYWDGEEYQEARSDAEAFKAIDSVDEGTLHFKPPHGDWGGHGVLLILGNGEDVISDYHCGDARFSALVDRVYAWINNGGADE